MLNNSIDSNKKKSTASNRESGNYTMLGRSNASSDSIWNSMFENLFGSPTSSSGSMLGVWRHQSVNKLKFNKIVFNLKFSFISFRFCFCFTTAKTWTINKWICLDVAYKIVCICFWLLINTKKANNPFDRIL